MTWAHVHGRDGRILLVCPAVDADMWWFPWTHWVYFETLPEEAACL